MKHKSVPIPEIEIVELESSDYSPLISKCQIKVCYVSDEPNRNLSIITKEVATKMASSLRGAAIVGYYNEEKEDFEEHNRILEISGNEIKLKETTKPYGFVDLNAKVWFQKFIDDDENEREYLMTEGYLWTGQYPETQRVIEKGNNQSMELDKKNLDAFWTKDINGKPKFFIINEAIVSRLCILGEEEEPCFEGASITKPTIQFSYNDSFKSELFSMINELKTMIEGGKKPMFTTFAVEIGDAIWSALYCFIENKFGTPDSCPPYGIDGIWEDGSQKFVILKKREDNKLYRMDFSYSEEGVASEGKLIEVKKEYTPVATPFDEEAVQAFETARYTKAKDEEELCPECGKPLDECICKKGKEYSLDEIPEYTELQTKYSTLETDFNALKEENKNLNSKIEELTQFKAEINKKEKQAMIDSFYMLSDEDKKEVVENIDSYSLDEIEGKLSIICVRNKVDFGKTKEEDPTSYSFNGDQHIDDTPAWIKAIQLVKEDIDN